MAITVVGMIAALALVAVTALPIVSVDVANTSCEVLNDSNPKLADSCEQTGYERHGPALILLGLFGAAVVWGAGVGESRPAGAALAVVGAVTLGVALLIDLPVTNDTGAIGPIFEGARAHSRIGFTLEIVAGALALAAGALCLLARE